ncbi:RNase A-like domain-containing protein [Microbacterium sp. M1A1_1b]
MSGVPIGDHGLVDPQGIPGAELDLTTVSAAATTISGGGDAMRTVADEIPGKWQALGAVYEAPESGQVLTLMDPVVDDTHTIGTAARGVAKALDTYASDAAGPKKQLDDLRVEAAAFVARVRGGVPKATSPYATTTAPQVDGSWNAYGATRSDAPPEKTTVPWYEDIVTKHENDDIIRRINEQVALLEQAQADCATAIKKASGASLRGAYVAPTENDLNARGVELPWSSVGTADGKTCGEQFSEGATNELLNSLESGIHMLGFDNQGAWSTDTLGSTWGGVVDGAATIGLFLSPYAWLDAALDPKGDAAKAHDAAGKAFGDWWSEAQAHPGAAAGAAAMGIGLGAAGPGGLAKDTAKATELAEGLGKLGLHGLSRDVRAWVENGASKESVDALHDLVDRTYRDYAGSDDFAPGLGTGDGSFDQLLRGEMAQFVDEHPDLLRPHDEASLPHGIESKPFTDAGGLAAAEAAGGHTLERHVRTDLHGQQLDDWIADRFDRERPNSSYTVSPSELDRLVANSLDSNHDAVQRWLSKMESDPGKKLTEDFDWPADRVVGRSFNPSRVPPMSDSTVVHTVLKYDPSRQPPYFVLTSYPIGEMG